VEPQQLGQRLHVVGGHDQTGQRVEGMLLHLLVIVVIVVIAAVAVRVVVLPPTAALQTETHRKQEALATDGAGAML
jgi:hypothetical protein